MRTILQNSFLALILSFPLLISPSDFSEASEDKSRLVLVEAEGVFNLGDETTMELAQRASLEAARRAAIEKAFGVSVTGSTLVRNAQLVENLVQVASKGLIIEEQVLEQGLLAQGTKGAHGTYRTKIRAKVMRLEPGNPRTNYSVQCRLNRTAYQHGDHAEIKIIPNQDSYLYVFNITEDEHLTVLVPNRFVPEAKVKGNNEFIFPPTELAKRGIHLTTMVASGKERSWESIKVIATRQPIEVLKRRAPEAIFEEYRPNDTTMLMDLLKTLAGLEPGEWTTCATTYEIAHR